MATVKYPYIFKAIIKCVAVTFVCIEPEFNGAEYEFREYCEVKHSVVDFDNEVQIIEKRITTRKVLARLSVVSHTTIFGNAKEWFHNI